jgi:putative transposase
MGCSDTSPYKTASMAVVPREWRAHHPWGPLANDWRDRGWIPYAKYSDVMARRAAFARDTIQDGDLVFRLGGPPCRFTGFDHSAFLAHLSDSSFSHVAIAHHRDGRVSIYDVAKEGVRDIPFEVWMEETRADTFTFAVKRIKPEHRGCIPAVLAYCQSGGGNLIPLDNLVSLGQNNACTNDLHPPVGGSGMDAKATRKPYPSDLTDQEWAILQPQLPPPVPAGAPRTTNLREVVNAILYRLHNGCAWRALPHDFPPEGTVRGYFHCWRRSGLWEKINDRLRRQVRTAEGRNEEPSAGIIDSQSAKGTRTSGTKGYDAGKKVKGTKRHVLVDTLGLLLCVVVHAANIQDRDGAKLVLSKARGLFPKLRLIWADGGYAGKLIEWAWRVCGWVLEIVKRSDTAKGWVLLPRRWVVERTFGWLSQCRALARDYEFHPETSEALLQVAMIHLMLRRLAKGNQAHACPC